MDNMKKIFLILCGVVILSVVVMVVLVLVDNNNGAKELICTSNNGNITLYYNNDTIIGYSSNGFSYDLLSEKNSAEQMGVDDYIDNFSNVFNTNTLGTCTD